MQIRNSLFLLSLAISSFAIADKAKVCDRHYVLGVNTQVIAKDQPPITGIIQDLVTELKTRVPCSYREQALALNKAGEELKANRIDFYAFIFPNEEWNSFADILILYSVERLLLVDKKFFSPKSNVTDYLRQKELKFALTSGPFLTLKQEVEPLAKSKRAFYVPFPDDILEALIQGKANAGFTSAAYYFTHKNRALLQQRFELVRDPGHPLLPLGLYMSKGRVSPEDRKKFEQAIQDMRAEGAIHRILRKYVPQDILEKYYSI